MREGEAVQHRVVSAPAKTLWQDSAYPREKQVTGVVNWQPPDGN